MPLRPDMNLMDYVAVLRRRKWLIVFSFLFIMSGAVAYSVMAPEQYRSSTTILVIPQKIPESYVRSTVSIRIEDRLATLQQQIMSRTRLAAIVEELGLFPEMRGKVSIEALVGEMRRRIEIDVVRGNEAFTLSFVHEDPRMAMLTTSRLASLFIDENLKAREQQAVGTSEFLESQLEEMKKKLEIQEEKVKNYKLRFMGELPEELPANLGALTRLQEQLRILSEGIRAAEDRKVFLEAQIRSLERLTRGGLSDNGYTGQTVASNDPVIELKLELASKKERLVRLSSRYTDKYPEVVLLRNEVELLEERIRNLENSSTPDTKGNRQSQGPLPVLTRISPEREEMRRLKDQILATEMEVASMKTEKEGVSRKIAEVQEKVNRAPRREQEIVSLTRDYENLKTSYNDLLKKKLDAEVSRNLESRQKGEQFQILDPANLPSSPFKPQRGKILGIAFLLSCGLGPGIAMCLEYLDQTIKNKEEFQRYTDMPILAVIPVVNTQEYRRFVLVKRVAVFSGLLIFLAASSIFVFLYVEKIRAIINF